MTLEEKIKCFNANAKEIKELNDEGEDLDLSVLFELLDEAVEIIELQKQLNSK
jgi:hypothetical protein